MSNDDAARLARVRRGFVDNVPHNRALGIEIVDVRDGEMAMRLPFDPRWVGNPETGALHGGVITALLDACGGGAVLATLAARGRAGPIATLDLRIDYLRPALAGSAVVATATCYKLTRNVAFVRATATTEGDGGEPVATATATFMLGTKVGDPAKPIVERS